MAEISEDMSERKNHTTAADAADASLPGVFQQSFQCNLQKENISVESDVTYYKDKTIDMLNESERFIQMSAGKESTSEVADMQGCHGGQIPDQGQSEISVKSKGFQGTDGKICTNAEERMHVTTEPYSKRFKSLSGVTHDGEEPLPPPNKGNIAFQSEDEYEHVTSGLVYVVTSYPSSGVPQDVYEDAIRGCECSGPCSDDCRCTLQYGCSYENGKLKASHYNKPIFECNDCCNCSADCPNRVVQKGPITGLKVLSVEDKGYGVVSSYSIPKNSFVCEYAGEYIGVDETHVRFSQQSAEGSNYILVLREHVQGSSSGPRITVIDPTVVGNIGRYVNHSCDPNLMVVPVRINSMLPLAALFAMRDILPGEELCYDYSNTMLQEEGEATKFHNQIDKLDKTIIIPSLCCDNAYEGEANLIHGSTHKPEGCEKSNVLTCNTLEGNESKVNNASSRPRKPCLCNAKNCRRYLPADKDII